MRKVVAESRLPSGLPRVLGAGFVLAGTAQVVLVLWPLGLGSADWELAAFGELSATWALPGLGCAALIAASTRSGLGAAWTAVAVLLVAGAIAVGGAVLVALNAPLVWHTALPAPALAQLKVATVKALALNSMYGLGYIGIGLAMFRILISKKAQA